MNQLLDAKTPTRPRFTEKQGQYLAFISTYGLLNGRSPAERDMQRFFGVTAPSVHQMVLTLERTGLIRRQPGLARSIELLVEPDSLPRLQPVQNVKSLCRGTRRLQLFLYACESLNLFSFSKPDQTGTL
ncbi:MarR family transcriptional regulator [Mesorhizobium waimense]|uniref:MarR family transcriptional regulator n=1 Tax=Mesorhizobium waimense TaxID=1300307 RepID=A0A3A5JRI3_9HYPH|nr:MarR family transcriptional regulator [Mesorhizobium waimense]